MKDFYSILGVARDAKPEAVKAAYRNLAQKFHPDLNKGNEQWAGRFMRDVNEAYAVLGDSESRKRYDALSRLKAVPSVTPRTPVSAVNPLETLIGLVVNAAAPYVPPEQLREVLTRKVNELGVDQKPLTLVDLAEQAGFLKRKRRARA